jgi:hypothetical protein
MWVGVGMTVGLFFVPLETACTVATEAALEVPAFRALEVVNVRTAVALLTSGRCAVEGAEPALANHHHFI